MLGLSFGKLLELAALILIVWYGFKFASRVEAVRNVRRRERESAPRPAAPPIQAEDLVRCAACGSYVAARGAAACARADCPWRG
jgi:hypothetical protein